MPLSQPTTLILRRTFPRPVTFADLREAFDSMPEYQVAVSIRHLDHIVQHWTWGGTEAQYMPIRREMAALAAKTRSDFSAALREVTGAVDEVYAVVDGREVHVTTVPGPGYEMRERRVKGITGAMVWDLLQKAEDAGYWQRPHEVRLDLCPSA